MNWKTSSSATGSHADGSGRRIGYGRIDGGGHVLVDHQPGWRPTVFVWMWIAAVVLLANAVLYIWASVKPPLKLAKAWGEDDTTQPSDGSNTLFQGDCAKASRIKTWSHIAVNILSTLLLMASSNCMQCLSAPTRQEVDKSHARGKHLDLGILSARNLSRIPWKRSVPWSLLALSSVPLHFFYNSIIFSSVAANEVMTLAVSKDFSSATTLNMAYFDELNKTYDDFPQDFDLGNDVWEQTARSLMPMSNSSSGMASQQLVSSDDCMKIFSAILVSGYRSVATVLSLANSSQVLDVLGPSHVGYRQPWTCYDPNSSYNNTAEFLQNCYKDCAQSDSTTMSGCAGYGSNSDFMPVGLPSSGWTFEGCYIEEGPQLCSVELSPQLLAIVIAANAVKVAVMLYTWRYLSFNPLVTLGDAIDTFMCTPDKSTAGLGPRSERDFKARERVMRNSLLPLDDNFPMDSAEAWQEGPRRWASAVSKTRWFYSIGLCLTLEIAAGILLGQSLYAGTFSESRQVGFGAIDPTFSTPYGSDSITMTEVALLGNLPQMLVSTVYVLYNALICAMLVTDEVSGFAKTRKSLRVSPPRRGVQRSSYYLTAPLRYSLPLIVGLTVLHWLISQSLFILTIDVIHADGTVEYGYDSGLGYSPVAIVASMAWGGVMILYPILLGLQKLPKGIPIMGHNSLAISTACHPDKLEPVDGSEQPLMYGVLPTIGRDGRRRVGFSSLAVEPLVDGEVYERTRCVYGVIDPHLGRDGDRHVCEEGATESPFWRSNSKAARDRQWRNGRQKDGGHDSVVELGHRRDSAELSDSGSHHERIELRELL